MFQEVSLARCAPRSTLIICKHRPQLLLRVPPHPLSLAPPFRSTVRRSTSTGLCRPRCRRDVLRSLVYVHKRKRERWKRVTVLPSLFRQRGRSLDGFNQSVKINFVLTSLSLEKPDFSVEAALLLCCLQRATLH